jgi:hypothetical protein
MAPQQQRPGAGVSLALAAVFLAAGPAVAGEKEKRPAARGPLPADLKLVPADTGGFVTIRAADLWNSPEVEKLPGGLLKQQPRFAKDFAREVGVEIGQLKRVTVVAPPGPRGEALVIVAAAGPLERKAVLKALASAFKKFRPRDFDVKEEGDAAPRWEKKEVGGKTYHELVVPGLKFLKGRKAVYFAGKRIYVTSTAKRIRQFLEAGPAAAPKGPVARALARAAGKELIVARVGLPVLAQMAKERPFKDLEGIQALEKAQSGGLTIVSSADTRATLRLKFAGEDEAAEAEKAARGIGAELRRQLAKARKGLAQALESGKVDEEQKPFLKVADKLLADGVEALGAATVEHKGASLRVSGRAPIAAGYLVALTMASRPPRRPPPPKESPAPPPAK